MKNEEQHMEFKDQVVRYLAGEMLPGQREQFEQLLETDKQKYDQFVAFKKIWDGVDQLAARSKYDLDGEWNMLAGRIGFEEEISVPRSGRTARLIALRIAAVLVIGVLGIAGWYGARQLTSFDKVAVGSGTREVMLPDGSTVTLNSGSTVKYSRKETAAQRLVKLRGEAYFEVSRDTLRPFVIDAGAAQIEVLGTSFNVHAYPSSGSIEVTVNTGLVALSSKKGSENLVLLSKGNTGIYTKKQKELTLVPSGNSNAMAWKTRIIEFTETPLDMVIQVISHTYRVEIELLDSSLSSNTITVTFNDQELEAVLKVISSTLDLSIVQSGERYLIDAE